jgi:hypothetical protein
MILMAVDLPLPARIVICVAIATCGFVVIGRVFLLRTPGSVRALSWAGQGPGFSLRLAAGSELPGRLAPGSFRLGHSCLLLWLRTRDGSHAVFIEGNRQEVRAFRALCRRLRWPPRVP